ncbi:MAG: redoxin domain-containing protein, partial [Bdellovibrionales bacterium]|nr:redoxin domain-containing protein [Bdellovibrionales bacterium]
VLNFLASWCEPCAGEMSDLNALYDMLGDQLVVVAVGVEDDDSLLRKFRDKYHVKFPFFHDKHGYAKVRYRLGGYPETFIIDPDGKFVLFPDPENGMTPSLKFIGPRRWSSEEMIQIFQAIFKRNS